ncbi:MAG: hypothetical protein K5925_02185 [Bacilli bacterium]|nr:hypothetical protein [Bacilli bacterium]
MNKGKLLLLSLLPIAGVFGVMVSLCYGTDIVFGKRAYASDTWYHYTSTYATSSYGTKEYWTNCKGTTQLSAPDGATIVESGAGDGDSIVASYGTGDERIINRFGSDIKFNGYEVDDNAITVDGILNANEYDGVTANKIDYNLHQSGDGSNITADFYVAYDSTYLYILYNVKDTQQSYRDFSSTSSNWTESNDAVEMRIDLLHDTSYAASDWTSGWGGNYRGSVMCEAMFKVAAGYDPTDSSKTVCHNTQYGEGIGCEFVWDYWWSSGCRGDSKTSIVSKTTETGYIVEMKVDCAKDDIPSKIRPINNTEIGLGIKIYNKTSTGGQTILLGEGYADAMGDTPRNCSTVTLHAKD